MRLERELWGLLEGPWAAPGTEGAEFRQDWLRRMREATTPEQVRGGQSRGGGGGGGIVYDFEFSAVARGLLHAESGPARPPTPSSKTSFISLRLCCRSEPLPWRWSPPCAGP